MRIYYLHLTKCLQCSLRMLHAAHRLEQPYPELKD